MQQDRWVKEAVHDAACGCCGTPLSADDVAGVGVRLYPELKMKRLTMGFVLCRCPQCETEQSLLIMVSYPDVRDTVWRFFMPGPHHEPDNAGGDEREKTNSSRAWNKVRPSRRSNAPKRPITKQEADRFLRRLSRTSFKLGTKGLNDFLRRLRSDRD
jgi:hypothetical protein